jgi:hypothetical protein
VTTPVVAPQPAPPMQFEPIEIASSETDSFAPTVVEQPRPRKKRVVKPRAAAASDGELPATALKDPFAP